jgi:hypothetical protein
MKYKYNGIGEVHLPKHKKTVQAGQIIEVTEKIDHPDFELLKEHEAKGKKK